MILRAEYLISLSSTSHILTFNTAPQESELMLAFVDFNQNVVSVTPPSGWVELYSFYFSGSPAAIKCFYKVAAAGESNSYDFVTTTVGVCEIMGYTISNYNQSSPFGNGGVTNSGASNVSSLATSSITVSDNSLVIAQYSMTGTPTTIPAMTNSFVASLGGIAKGTAQRIYSTGGVSQSTTFSAFGGVGRMRTIIIEIKAAL